MKFAKAFLWINCAVFGLYAICFIFWPQTISMVVVDSAPELGPAMTDMRATYGGMMLGLALLFGLLAREAKTLKVGLQGVIIVLALMAASRGLGMVIDNDTNTMMVAFLIAEAIGVAVGVLALNRLK